MCFSRENMFTELGDGQTDRRVENSAEKKKWPASKIKSNEVKY